MTATMHRSGGSWLTTWTPERVVSAPDPVVAFAEFVQQKLGVPWPTQKDLAILRKKITEFFEHYPKLTYFTLCRVVEWCRSRHRRYDRVWKVIDAFRYAWTDGVLPELDPDQTDDSVEDRITAALAVETSPTWRRYLLGATGVSARRQIIEEWEAKKGTTSGAH
jgi:hypothetical protein